MEEIPIIGVSPGNSFFTDSEIENLLQKVLSKYTETVIFIADVPAQNTYQAIGYTQKEAKRKSSLKGNNLRNKFQRIADRMNIPRKCLIFSDWKEIEKSTSYKRAYNEIKSLYKNNKNFQSAANNTTRMVLCNYDKSKEWRQENVEIAVEYLLCELAYLQASPDIIGSNKICYVYNKHWPIYEKLISGEFDQIERIQQHFWLVESQSDTFSSITYKSAWERIKKTKIIRAGYFPCMNRFIENRSGLSGFMYDVFMEITSKEGWQIDWVERTGYGVIIDRLNAGHYDIFCSTVWPTCEREEQLAFSDSMFEVPCYLWKNSKKKDIKSIAVKHGDVHDSYAEKLPFKVRRVYVPQFSDVISPLRFVDQGRADATFAEPDHVQAYKKENSKALLVKNTEVLIKCTNSFVFSQKEIELKNCFDQHIKSMKKSGFIKELIKHYNINCI